ncbi:MAG: transposase [Gracilibacteraceae bacterium]|jgi:hypothetical protein|nr:transposase [Gracilibacteraceae bacterium]
MSREPLAGCHANRWPDVTRIVGRMSREPLAGCHAHTHYDKRAKAERAAAIAKALDLVEDPSKYEEKLREEEKYDGYYAIVTSEWKESDEKILDIYRGLWQIEEAFRVCKSDLEARPVYLSRLERIDAHFLICFIALVIARLLTRTLDNQFSVGRIAESLGRASGSHMDENWYLFDHVDEVTKAVAEKMGIDLGRKFITHGEIRQLIGDTKKG